jgi:cytidylate kinase
VRRDQDERDRRDASADRTVHEPAPDAIPLDTTGLSLDAVVGQLVTLAFEARELR